MDQQAVETILFPIYAQLPQPIPQVYVDYLYILADKASVPRQEVDQSVVDYQLKKLGDAFGKVVQASPAPVAAPAVDMAALVTRDRTGLLQEVLQNDVHGYSRTAFEADTSGNIVCAVVGQMLDKVFILRDTLARDASGALAKMLQADPTGRAPESAATLYAQSVEPSTMPPPARVEQAAYLLGFKSLPHLWSIVGIQVLDANGAPAF